MGNMTDKAIQALQYRAFLNGTVPSFVIAGRRTPPPVKALDEPDDDDDTFDDDLDEEDVDFGSDSDLNFDEEDGPDEEPTPGYHDED